MAQVEKEKLRKKRHETLKAAAIRLIKHEVQERAKIQQSIKQRMMLQQQELIHKKKHYDLHKLEHTNQSMEDEKDSIEEDNKFIKNLSDGLKKKHESKLNAIKNQ